jgi:5-formyltetrahydrofolate cyclo-ligase
LEQAPGLGHTPRAVADKQAIRERIWAAIDGDAALRRPPGAAGRIPNFAGAELAAERLAELSEWQRASVVKVNPDTPQLALRARAIEAGKLLIVPVPKLTVEVPFLALDKRQLGVSAFEAASKEGAARYGKPTRLEQLVPVDCIVCGTVAVNAAGVRIGKGGGYADLEFALLVELGLVGPDTLIATTVHDVQLLAEDLPETEHDFRVDVIATPTRIIRCPPAARPRGIVWEHLDRARLDAIPLLAERARREPASGR